MSNVSSANAQGFWNEKFRNQDIARQERLTTPTTAQNQFNRGTINLLDEARSVVENAVGQGQELNPLIYQMLGLEPKFSDHSGELDSAQQEMDAAQSQFNAAKETATTLSAIPKGKRSRDQKKQLRQLQKQMPSLERGLGDAKAAFGQLQTMPKAITGLTRMNPEDIPSESPFSANNALNQAQATEADQLNKYLAGGEVDPTLKHQYDAAESALRAKLAQRFGPDFEASSVGQMALANFTRQKNEAFATWNQQQVEKYNAMAFQGQANLQALLAQRIGMLQQPAQNQINAGTALTNMANPRMAQEQIANNFMLGRAGLQPSSVVSNPLPGMASGGLGSLLTTPDAEGNTLIGKAASGVGSAAGGVYGGLKQGASGLYNWASGLGGGEAAAGSAAADMTAADMAEFGVAG